MSLKARREAQLEIYKKAALDAVDPKLAAMRAEHAARCAVARERYPAEIARLTETIMGYLDNGATEGRCWVQISVGFSREELDRQRRDPERVGFRRMWEAIIDDLRSSDYEVTNCIERCYGMQFLDDESLPAWEALLDGSPIHYYIKLR